MEPCWQRWWTRPMAWYLVGGTLLIAASLWLPWVTATRTTRIERRAERIAAVLLAACAEAPHGDDRFAQELLLARFWRLAAVANEFIDDVEIVDPPLPGSVLVLRNKHYAFQLAISPLPPDGIVGHDTEPTREVLAWPLSPVGPGHCAFFLAEDAPRAYTRNLAASWAGLDDRRPWPGAALRLPNSDSTRPGSYRARLDERWILY